MLFSKFMLIVDATGAGYDGHWAVALVSKDDLHLRLALTYKIQNNSQGLGLYLQYINLQNAQRLVTQWQKSQEPFSKISSTGLLDLLNDVSGACCIMVL